MHLAKAKTKTELVDWKVLTGQGDRGRSDELMKHVASLFSLTAGHCTEEQLETYDIVMQRLADLVCEDTRFFAAMKICHLENAPYKIVRRFAFDTIKVADPVLRNSPVLRDADLIEVGNVKSDAHMVSMCMRKNLTSVVTDVFIRSGKGTVMIKLVANASAEISPKGMEILDSAAANDRRLAKELGLRTCEKQKGDAKTPHCVANEGQFDLQTLWREIEPSIEERMYDLSGHSYLSRYRFDSSLTKIETLREQGLLGKGILEGFAGNDQFADLVCAIARLSGFSHQIVARMMSGLQWNQILALFRLLDFSDQLLRSILTCGPWMLCLSGNQVVAVTKQYRNMTFEEARNIVLSWTESGLLLD